MDTIRLKRVNERVSIKKEMITAEFTSETHIGFKLKEIKDLNNMLNCSPNKSVFEYKYLRKMVDVLLGTKEEPSDVVMTRLLDTMEVEGIDEMSTDVNGVEAS